MAASLNNSDEEHGFEDEGVGEEHVFPLSWDLEDRIEAMLLFGGVRNRVGDKGAGMTGELRGDLFLRGVFGGFIS